MKITQNMYYTLVQKNLVFGGQTPPGSREKSSSIEFPRSILEDFFFDHFFKLAIKTLKLNIFSNRQKQTLTHILNIILSKYEQHILILSKVKVKTLKKVPEK